MRGTGSIQQNVGSKCLDRRSDAEVQNMFDLNARFAAENQPTSFDRSRTASRAAARIGMTAASALLAIGLSACSGGGVDDGEVPLAAAVADAEVLGTGVEAVETSAPASNASATASRTSTPTVNPAPTRATTTAAPMTTARTTVPTATTTSAAPPTTSGPSSAATAKVNSLDTIIDDMRLKNDLVLRGYESRTVGWYVGPGYNMMGIDARTTNTPEWWKNAYPWLVNSTYMKAALPWAVVFDGVGHASTNTRVQLRNFVAYYKSRSTGQWISWGSSKGLSGYATPKSDLFNGSIAEDKRTNADGSVDIKPPGDANYAWHGWWDNGRVPINATDIAAVFVSLQARLVVDDPSRPDDRSAARLLVWAGADYYIDGSTPWSVPNPAISASRIKRVTNEWQAFSATTLSDVGIQEPGGGITSAQFRAAPPPLQ